MNIREIVVVRSFEKGNRFDLWMDPLLVKASKHPDVEGGQHGHNDLLQENVCLSLTRHPIKRQI